MLGELWYYWKLKFHIENNLNFCTVIQISRLITLILVNYKGNNLQISQKTKWIKWFFKNCNYLHRFYKFKRMEKHNEVTNFCCDLLSSINWIIIKISKRNLQHRLTKMVWKINTAISCILLYETVRRNRNSSLG